MSQIKESNGIPGPDLLSLIEGRGGVLDSFEDLTRLKRNDSSRASFRLNLADGRVFKGRQFDTVEKQAAVTSLLAILVDFPFSPIIASRGIATLEGWIDGSPLVLEDIRNEQLAAGANILGRLHCVRDYPVEPQLIPKPQTVSLDPIERELGNLVDEGLLRGDAIIPLLKIAEDSKPTELESGLIHTDFHPGNMVAGVDGKLHIVDNERINIGPLDFDLARSWSRWPMNDSQREIFRNAYEEYRCLDTFIAHEKFWAVLSLVRTAYIHARYKKVNQMALDQLHRLLVSNGKTTWPTPGGSPIPSLLRFGQ